MTRRFLALLTVLLLCALCLPAAMAEDGEAAFSVVLPDGYEGSGRFYPVAYILPQDGYAIDDSSVAGLLTAAMESGACTDLILVLPAFEAEADPRAQLAAVTAQVDEAYRTIARPTHRMLIGTGSGAYLAYMLGLTDQDGKALAAPDAYGVIAGIRGDYSAGPWTEKLGSLYDLIEGMQLANPQVFDAFYTYMDAPVDDAATGMPGSTADLCSLFIGFGTGSAAHECTLRPGTYDSAFLQESISRIAQRFTARLFTGAASGTIRFEKTTLTADDENAHVSGSVTIAEACAELCPGDTEVVVTVTLRDPADGSGLVSVSSGYSIAGSGVIEYDYLIPNRVNGVSSDAVLSIGLLGTELELASATLIRSQPPVIDGGMQSIELLGDWHFNYVGAQTVLNAEEITPDVFSSWSVVQPTLGNWTKGYGNISEENVFSGYGPDYFDFFITGSGYYARTFDVPESFDTQDLILSIGYVDDRCEVFLNGVRVGATGMDENGQPTGETTWSVYSRFDIDPALLKRGAQNTIVVRAYNDLPFGAGGWNGGPVGLYSREAFDAAFADAQSDRFYEASFDSAFAAAAQGKEGAVENKYLIYLPKGYHTSDRRYPTVYLLHQFNSDHTSYRGDKVNELFDRYMDMGLFEEMIVVIPNSSEESWWTGSWEKMITDELIPMIDGQYRTIQDARFRMTAGCSMGGQGAMAVALRNPDAFSGALSFFGAFSYGGASSPNAIAAAESAEYLDSFALYFICGNQDSYGFGVPAIGLHLQLLEKGVDHGFLIDNGGHDSGFYLPFFDDAFAYMDKSMYAPPAPDDSVTSAEISVSGNMVTGVFRAEEGLEAYYNAIPASSYTKNQTPPLMIPITMELHQGDHSISTLSGVYALEPGQKEITLTYDLADRLTAGEEYSVHMKAWLFDQPAERIVVTFTAE